jgi:parvulin-like peptidyl-prolyl isomerase
VESLLETMAPPLAQQAVADVAALTAAQSSSLIKVAGPAAGYFALLDDYGTFLDDVLPRTKRDREIFSDVEDEAEEEQDEEDIGRRRKKAKLAEAAKERRGLESDESDEEDAE